ncbi:hypothetical protein SERLADRAFT_469881, partial [Serpula lacrymans var. lacrymans S7.9]
MSDVGGVVFDKDSVWINVPGSFTRGNTDIPQGEGEQMVMDLQDVDATLEDNIARGSIRLFGSSSNPISVDPILEHNEEEGVGSDEEDSELDDIDSGGSEHSSDEDDVTQDDDDDDEGEDEAGMLAHGGTENHGRSTLRKVARPIRHRSSNRRDANTVEFADSDSELGHDDDHRDGSIGGVVRVDNEQWDAPSDTDGDEKPFDEEAPAWKSNLSVKASEFFQLHSHKQKKDWMALIYSSKLSPHQIVTSGVDASSAISKLDDGDDFFSIREANHVPGDSLDMSKELLEDLSNWADTALLDSIRSLFITGEKSGSTGDNPAEQYEDIDGGDFEDLEANASLPDVAGQDHSAKKEELKRKFNEQYDDPEATKMDFYDEKKEEMNRQLQLNRVEFENVSTETRALVEGYRPGTYLRLELTQVPCEMIEHFDPMYPIV